MSSTPDVSVIIPTYDRAELLRATLGSVLAQTAPPREIAVVDDGSTDHTAEVVRELSAGGTPIIYLPGPRRNLLGELRNRGVAATSGEWVAFLDSDDLWQPQRLERQFEALRANTDAAFAFCNLERFSDEGPVGDGPWLPPTADFNGFILGDLLEEQVVVPSALMVRRDVFDRFGGFTSHRRIDPQHGVGDGSHALLLRIALHHPASYVPEPLLLMRAHSTNRSVSRRETAMLEYLEVVGSFLASHPDLPSATRARGRRGLANVHYKLAMLYMRQGDRAATRRHLRDALKLRPWDRRALGAYWRSVARRPLSGLAGR